MEGLERGLTLLLLVLRVLLACMPTAHCGVAPPLIDGASDYIIIASNSGFANRIRVLSAFLFLKERVFNASRIVMVWDTNEECTGRFLDVMDPIPNVTFISSQETENYERSARYLFPASYATFNFILRRYGVRYTEKYYGYLFAHIVGRFIVPREVVWHVVQAFVNKHDICRCLAIHIRSTDFIKFAKRNNITATAHCESRALKQTGNSTIFLMTDSMQSRLEYIDSHNKAKVTTFGEFNSSMALSLRKTFLNHTIIEVLIAAHSNHFCGNYPSSSLHSLIVAYRRFLRSYTGGYVDKKSSELNTLSGCHSSNAGRGSCAFAIRETVCQFRAGRNIDTDREMWRKSYEDIKKFISM